MDLDLKAEFERVLAGHKQVNRQSVANYYTPNMVYRSVALLAPEDFEWTGFTQELWLPVEIFHDPTATVVLHGHDKKKYCRNDYFCHVLGYRPTGKEKPKFLKGFYEKWRYFNEAPTYPLRNDVSEFGVDLSF